MVDIETIFDWGQTVIFTRCSIGGELTIILLDTALITATQRMEQLRKEIRQLAIRYVRISEDPLSGSFGIAIYPSHGSTVEQLLKVADDSLYQANQADGDTTVPR